MSSCTRAHASQDHFSFVVVLLVNTEQQLLVKHNLPQTRYSSTENVFHRSDRVYMYVVQ